MMGYGYGSMMGGGMMGGGFGGMMWPWMILVSALVIAGLVALILVIVRHARTARPQAVWPQTASALRILDERYARGELDHEEYRQRRRNIG